MKRKFFAAMLLSLLLVVPFVNWRLGALMWMCAWLVFIFQNVFSRKGWHIGGKGDHEENPDRKE
ncbi:hypothetical protein ACFL6N_00850 [Thermodesulfobacteriota bacterium]